MLCILYVGTVPTFRHSLILFWTLHLTLLLQTPGWILEDVWTMLESSKLSILSMLVVVTPTHTMVLYPDSMMVELGLL